jgi:hypothetical protein
MSYEVFPADELLVTGSDTLSKLAVLFLLAGTVLVEYLNSVAESDLPPIDRSKFNVRFGLEEGGQDGQAEAHRRADHQ